MLQPVVLGVWVSDQPQEESNEPPCVQFWSGFYGTTWAIYGQVHGSTR